MNFERKMAMPKYQKSILRVLLTHLRDINIRSDKYESSSIVDCCDYLLENGVLND